MAESIETRIQVIEQKLDALEKSIPSADCIAGEISEALKKTMSGAEENAASITLTEKDLHCIARMLQGAFYKQDQLYCCRGYCLYSKECSEKFKQSRTMHFNTVRNKLTDATGVYNRLICHDTEERMLENSYFASVSQKNPMQDSCP